VLECILEKLPPDSLCQMAGVCHSLPPGECWGGGRYTVAGLPISIPKGSEI
jgi:hypothetical protein